MTGHGGSRRGSGRKSKSERFLGPIAEAEARIADRLPSLIDNLFTLADGVTVEEPMPNGGVQVYTRAPDRQANEYLINRIMGKPVERLEHSGEDGDAIEVTATVCYRAGNELAAWREQQSARLSELPLSMPRLRPMPDTSSTDS
jgi:hypothetical protein